MPADLKSRCILAKHCSTREREREIQQTIRNQIIRNHPYVVLPTDDHASITQLDQMSQHFVTFEAAKMHVQWQRMRRHLVWHS